MSDQYFIRLQDGISGGFAPPTPRAVHTLTKSLDDPTQIVIQTQERPSGTPDAGLVTKNLAVGASFAGGSDASAKVAEVKSLLQGLPHEYPPGSEDIYGLDVGLMFGSDDFEWINGGPSGCGGGQSEVQATPEQKERFRKAVEIVRELVKEGK